MDYTFEQELSNVFIGRLNEEEACVMFPFSDNAKQVHSVTFPSELDDPHLIPII